MINSKITGSCPTNMPSKYYIKRYKKQKTLKDVRLTTFQIRFPALSACVISCICCVTYTSFNVLTSLFLFYSIWWQFLLKVKFSYISWHSFSKSCWFKAGFHLQRSRSCYDPMKTAFGFCWFRLRFAYDLVKTRLSESEAEPEELSQSQSMGTYIVIGFSFHFCFRLRQSGFH